MKRVTARLVVLVVLLLVLCAACRPTWPHATHSSPDVECQALGCTITHR